MSHAVVYALMGLLLLALGVGLPHAVHHRESTAWVFLARKIVGPGFMLAGAALLIVAVVSG